MQTFSIQNDTANGQVDVASLFAELVSAASAEPAKLYTRGDALFIQFTPAFDATAVVAAHQGTAATDELPPVTDDVFDPAAANDASQGYRVGSIRVDSQGRAWIAVDVSVGGSHWDQINLDTFPQYQLTSQRGQAGGYASLDPTTGKVPTSQLPDTFVPTLVEVADAAARLALTPGGGDEVVQLDDGSQWIYSDTTNAWIARATGNGDVTGPGGATASAIAVYNGTTGKVLANSAVTIDGGGNLTTPGTVDGVDVAGLASTTNAHIADNNNPHGVSWDDLGTTTLSSLDALVSNATIDGAGAARPPEPHTHPAGDITTAGGVVGQVLTNVSGTCQWADAPGSVPNVFGTGYTYASAAAVSTTTSTVFQNKITMTTAALPAGRYEFKWFYNWNVDSISADFESRIAIDGNAVQWADHYSEPIDRNGSFGNTGTDQKYVAGGWEVINLDGVHVFTLDWRSSKNGRRASIWNARIALHRID